MYGAPSYVQMAWDGQQYQFPGADEEWGGNVRVSRTEELLAERGERYGDPLTNHTRIAKLWSVILEFEVTPAQVAMCMLQVKAARLVATPGDEDSVDDLIAYASIYKEIS